MKVFFSVGEPSGDVHGANLIRALKKRSPEIQCVGFGGPKMRQAGADLLFDLTSLAVMWIGRVLWNIRTFFKLADQAEEYFKTEKPDAVVLIDYPGFNWHIAKRAHKAGIPVYYYSPPQLWGWAQWRVKKMRLWVDCILSGLTFESKWYKDHGCNCVYVGHPFFDEVVRQPLDSEFIRQLESPKSELQKSDFSNEQSPLIAILPGSRTQEVERNLETFLQSAQIITRQIPQARFVIAAFKEKHREIIDKQIEKISSSGRLNIQVYVGKTPEIMAAAEVVMSVSGSVSLELLYHLKPTVILYQVSRFGIFIQQFFRKVKYITLVNLLQYSAAALTAPDSEQAPNPHDALFPEYLTCGDESQPIAEHLLKWLVDSDAKEVQIRLLEQLNQRVCQPGAADKAAEIILLSSKMNKLENI